MTNNWRDTLTNYNPAYNAQDWAALNSRLQSATPLSPWKKRGLFVLFAALLFTSGFVVRGLLVEKSYAPLLSSTAIDQSSYEPGIPPQSQDLNGNEAGQQSFTTSEKEPFGVNENGTSTKSVPLKGTSEKTTYTKLYSSVSNQTVTGSNTFTASSPKNPKNAGGRTQLSTDQSAAHTVVNPTIHNPLEFRNHISKESHEHETVLSNQMTMKEHESSATVLIKETVLATLPERQDSSKESIVASIDSLKANGEPSQARQQLTEKGAALATSIQTPEMTEIRLTFSPFYQTSGVKKRMLGVRTNPEPPKALMQTHELGLDMYLGKNLYTGLGYGYHFWDNKYAGISNYRSHAPFIRVGISVPVLRNFDLIAQAGASVLIESFEFDQQQWVDGSLITVTKSGSATGNIANYGLGGSYTFKRVHSIYGLLETSGRNFTIGYKYHLFDN